MSQPLNPPAMIALIAAAIVILVIIGYKTLGPSHAPERTDAAHQQVVAAMAAARAAKQQSKPPTHP